MAEPDPDDDWLIIESYARWAGDTSFASDMLSRAEAAIGPKPAAPPATKLRSIPLAVMEWAGQRKRREEPSRRELEYQDKISEPEAVEQQPDDRKPTSPFFQSRNLRAAVYMVAPRDFELRAYPINLDAVEQLIRRAAKAQLHFAAAGPVEGPSAGRTPGRAVQASGSSWVMPGRLLRFVWVDAFGLIFVRGIWTAPEPVTHVGEVYNSFREVLRELDQ